jgi:carbonic anhydrase
MKRLKIFMQTAGAETECTKNRLKFNYNQPLSSFTIDNTGHTAQISVEPAIHPQLTVSGGGLIGQYKFSQLHFHWSSEHSSNGTQFSGEHTQGNQTIVVEVEDACMYAKQVSQ